MPTSSETIVAVVNGEIVDKMELVRALIEAADKYYNSDEEVVSDTEFDAAERILRAIDPENDYFQNVGSDIRTGKEKLPFEMYSLDQVYEGDTERWVKGLKADGKWFVITDKLDGLSGCIIYDKYGRLTKAFSRGNGKEGADITRHVRKMKHVPKMIKNDTGADLPVRVEFIIPKADFPTMKAQILQSTGRDYKNARNFASGMMNKEEALPIFYDHVHAVVTSVFDVVKLNKQASLELCSKAGLMVTTSSMVEGRDINDDVLVKYLTERREKSLYEIDGIVVDVEDIAMRDTLGPASNGNPGYAKKFKVRAEDNIAEVTVVNVEWNPSKAGYLKPRVEIVPVDLAGVTVTYCTGYNAKFIIDSGIGPGAVVKITRSGEVIPNIIGIVKSVAPQLPPASFGTYTFTPGNVDIVLDNKSIGEVVIRQMIDAFDTLEVPNLREGSITKLHEAGFDTIAKVINASESDLKNVIGDSAGSKVYQGIRDKLNGVSPAKLFAASQTLGRGMGVRKLTKLFDVYDDILTLNVQQIAAVDGFSIATAQALLASFADLQTFLQSIAGQYTLGTAKAPVVAGGDLMGVSVVFTGIRDKDLEAKIAARGGAVIDSVKKGTTYLVCKDVNGGSSKLKKAADLGVTLLSIDDARNMWG